MLRGRLVVAVCAVLRLYARRACYASVARTVAALEPCASNAIVARSVKHSRQSAHVVPRVCCGHGVIPSVVFGLACSATTIAPLYPRARASASCATVSHDARTLTLPHDSRATVRQACVYVHTGWPLRALGFRVAGAGEHWPYVGRVISPYSYAKGGMAYLEEDCDAGAYMVALDADGIARPAINPVHVGDHVGATGNPRNMRPITTHHLA